MLAILQIFKHCPYFDSQCSVPRSYWCLDQCLVSKSLIVPRSSWVFDQFIFSGLMLRSSTIVSISWYMFVSYMKLLSLLTAMKCEFTEVIWVIWKWLRMAQIWFCHSLVRYSYYIWDASMTRTNIGGLTDQEMIFGYFVYDAHVIDVVCVHCRSSIVDHSHFINRSWPFFYNYHCLVNRCPLYFCLLH